MEGLTFDVGMNTSGFNRGVKNIEGSMGNLGKTAGRIGGMIAGALGGTAIMGAIKKSISGFQEMETGLREISTLVSGDMQPTIEKYGESVENVMKATGNSTDEATSAVYNFVSAFGDLDDASGILEVASKQSIAGVTETKTAIDFLASTIFGFGAPATEEMAMQMANLGQMTVKLARTTLPELEAAIRESTATANQLNVSPEEYFANIAAGTKILGSATQTGTAFKMVLSNLLKPTEAMTEALSGYAVKIGLSEDASAAAIIAADGFSVGLRGIVKEAGGSDEKLGEMFQSVNALNLAMALTGPLTSEVDKNLTAMGDTAGTVDEAYEKMADTSEMTTKKMKAQAEIFTSTFGELFDSVTRPMVENFTVVMEGWTDRLKTFTKGFKDWQAELANDDSVGGEMLKTLTGAAPLTVPIMFAVAATQRGLASMLESGVGGLGKGLQLVGGKLLSAAGTAAMSIGISIGISDMQENAKEGAFKQVVAGALGVAAGALTGSVAAGQMVYGITVAVETVFLDSMKTPTLLYESMEGQIETLKTKIEESVSNGFVSTVEKTDIAAAWSELGNRLSQLQSKAGWEQILTVDQKEIKKSAEEFYDVFGEALKETPGTESFTSGFKEALMKMQDSLFDLHVETREKRDNPLEKLWGNIFGIDVYEDGKFEAGMTMNIIYKPDSESENAIKSFISEIDAGKTFDITANSDPAIDTMNKIEALKINDKTFTITGVAGEGPGGGGGGGFSAGGYTANVGINAPAGVVHGGEWIAPAWMVNNSKYSETIDSLENARNNRGYSNGGIVSPQAAGQSTTNINVVIEQFVGTGDEAGNTNLYGETPGSGTTAPINPPDAKLMIDFTESQQELQSWLEEQRSINVSAIATSLDTAQVDGQEVKMNGIVENTEYDTTPLQENISGIFKKVQDKITTMKDAISEALSSGMEIGVDTKTFSTQVASLVSEANGKTAEITIKANDQATSVINTVQSALSKLQDKTITVTVLESIKTTGTTGFGIFVPPDSDDTGGGSSGGGGGQKFDRGQSAEIKIPVERSSGSNVTLAINVETLVGDNEEAANILASTVYKKLEEQGVLA